MSIKPILFNTEMVRAILDGRKTQTRRVIKTTDGIPLSEYSDIAARRFIYDMDKIDIKLDPEQSGYDVVAEYIERYWEHVSHDDVILYIGISSDGEDYYRFKEIACVNENGDIEFADDWWEGEKFIQLYGIKAISDIPISGGLFEEE